MCTYVCVGGGLGFPWVGGSTFWRPDLALMAGSNRAGCAVVLAVLAGPESWLAPDVMPSDELIARVHAGLGVRTFSRR